MAEIRISIVICAHNEERGIASCLTSAVETMRGEPWWEVLLVDNASSDKTAEIAATIPGVRVVRESQKGLTYARQRGLLEAKGDLLAYLDADVRLSKNWLSLIKKTFVDQNIVCLSGPRYYYDIDGVRKFLADGAWWLFAPLTYWIVGYMVLGGNFVARKSALEAMGGFDTTIRFYGEDTNIAWRLAKVGKVVWRMKFFVYSSGRRFVEEGLIRIYFIYGMNYLWEVLFHKPYTRDYRDVR